MDNNSNLKSQDYNSTELVMKKIKVIILGAGNMLDDIVEILKLKEISDFQIFDDFKTETQRYMIAGTFDQAVKKYKGKAKFIFGFGTAKTTKLREKVYNKYEFNQNDLINIIHPRACVSPMASLGNGIVVKANATIMPNAKLGDNIIISQLVSVSHHVTICSHSILAPSSSCSGGSIIKSSCFLGTNCSINENITIGRNSIIGIGATVRKDLKENSIKLR